MQLDTTQTLFTHAISHFLSVVNLNKCNPFKLHHFCIWFKVCRMLDLKACCQKKCISVFLPPRLSFKLCKCFCEFLSSSPLSFLTSLYFSWYYKATVNKSKTFFIRTFFYKSKRFSFNFVVTFTELHAIKWSWLSIL